MKRISKLILLLAVVALASCDSTNSTKSSGTDQSSQPEDVTPTLNVMTVKLSEYGNCDNCPNITSIDVDGENITINQDGTPYLYKIDKDESCEAVEYKNYFWNFRITRVEEQSPDYGEVSIPKFMDDIYGQPGKYDIYPCYISTTECYKARQNDDYSFDDGFYVFTIANEIVLERGFLEKHPESKPLPELSFDIKGFSVIYGVEISGVPNFVKSAKKVMIKDNMVLFSTDTKTVVLEIIPLSDMEVVYSEGYNWYFVTKADGDIPSMRMCVNAGFEEKVPNPDERWISLSIEDIGYYDVKFNSWPNLKRKIMATYPTDEEYNNTMEEGILPDLSDEEEY